MSGTITNVPPSAPLLISRIQHYKDLRDTAMCESQQMCYDLVATELELLLDELTTLEN